MNRFYRQLLSSRWSHRLKSVGAGIIALLILLTGRPELLSAAAKDPKTFSSPQEAVQALIQAASKNDTRALLALFGPDGKDIVESGDSSDDKDGRAQFTKAAGEKMSVLPDPMNPDKVILTIGQHDWPFPVPLVRKDGRWSFDSAEGRHEILSRRIGANELSAIEICRGYVEAQNDYAQTHKHNGAPEYAQKIRSSSGRQDGLYWKSKKGSSDCDVSKGFADASTGLKGAEPYHGYYFRILKAQGPDARGGELKYEVNGALIGGFALIAWPAKYGVSGIQTFMVNHDGTVYEKHLGTETESAVEKITVFNPDATWRAVTSEEPSEN
jgi:hypothetical protein